MTASPIEIVILGGSFSAVQTTHYILKHIHPTTPVKLTIIAPSPDLYWVISSPRTILNIPTLLDKKSTLINIPASLRTAYGAEKEGSVWSFEQGWARGVDLTANTVSFQPISGKTSEATQERKVLRFDHLVIATGSRNYNPHQTPRDGSWLAELELLAPFKQLGTTEELTDSITAWGDKIKAGNTIFVAGAGATGIEVAAEIKQNYPNKKVIIAGTEFLGQARKNVSDVAKRMLSNLGVEVRTGVKVTTVRNAVSGQGLEVTLSTGETIPADVFIPSFGQKPNSDFLPREILDKDGYVVTTTHFNLASNSNVWAIGDITHFPGNRKLSVVGDQIPVLGWNLKKAVEGSTDGLKEYKHSTNVLMMVTVGSGGGTGQIGWFRPWNWMVWLVKSRHMMINMFPPLAIGASSPKKA